MSIKKLIKSSRQESYQVIEKVVFLEAGQKHSDARRVKSRGMRRTSRYAAMTRDERNAADGCFSTAC